MALRLFETRQRQVVPFEPTGHVVRMYTCGITPYDATHIGHAATFLAYDVLQRRLRDLGYDTRCVRNVTDVDDDILERARTLGVHYLDLAATALATFESDMAALGMLAPHSEPRATSAISEVRELIGRVLDSGHAYESNGNVYFDVASAPDFGSLSGLSREAMFVAAASSTNLSDPAKRDPLDFVLWQASAPGEPEWSSRWGPGRPGWHVECSALALRELGDDIDLHGGGTDLVFPHHECEQAQAVAATGRPFVRHWLHTGAVHFEGEKMSKSLGNLAFVSELRKLHDPMVLRLALLDVHYRSTWEWRPELLDQAADRYRRWQVGGGGEGPLDDVGAALDDDLDTRTAIAHIDAAADRGAGVEACAALLGVLW